MHELVPLPPEGSLAALEETVQRAHDYAAAARAPNTRRAYAADWRHFTNAASDLSTQFAATPRLQLGCKSPNLDAAHLIDRFDGPAKQALVLAREGARGLGHAAIVGTEHVLLALVRESE